MVTILDILNTLVTKENKDNIIESDYNKIKNYISDTFKITDFQQNTSHLIQILTCIKFLYNIDIDKLVINIKNKLLDDNDILELPFNKKKILVNLDKSDYNNELILYLSYILDINIIIYYDDINIFRLYYVENYFNRNKSIILLKYVENYYTGLYTFQTLYNNTNLYDSIIDNFKSYIYPIGLEENKLLIETDEEDSINYTIDNQIDNLVDYNYFKLPKSINYEYINYLLKSYKFKDYRLFKYYGK